MTNSWHVPLFPSLPHGALKPFGIGQHFLFFRLVRDVQTLGNWPSAQGKVKTKKTRRDDTEAHLTLVFLNEEKQLFINDAQAHSYPVANYVFLR